MADAIFENDRLAEIYDSFDADRSDLDAYEAIVSEFQAKSVLDIGCGTGTFACRLADRGINVIGVDPAKASLRIAMEKTCAKSVKWIHGTIKDIPPLKVDAVTMTANVAQVFLSDEEWQETLLAIYNRLRPNGKLIFETRKPEAKAWLKWNKQDSYKKILIPDIGMVEGWVDITDVKGDYVSFQWTYIFENDGAIITSNSTLRFRSLNEISSSLKNAKLSLEGVREAPDRPGLQNIFIASKL